MADDSSEDENNCICTCLILPALFVAPITIFALSLVIHNPKLYIQDFYVPALINSVESNTTRRLNTFIFVDLKLENAMPFNGLRYGDLNITFFYGPNRSLPVATYALAGFYQGHRKTAHKTAVVRTRGLPWEDAFQKVSAGSTVEFTVALDTTVKLRRCGVYTKEKAVVVAGDVRMDGSGVEVRNKAVRLE